jgi:hypothetical protein
VIIISLRERIVRDSPTSVESGYAFPPT